MPEIMLLNSNGAHVGNLAIDSPSYPATIGYAHKTYQLEDGGDGPMLASYREVTIELAVPGTSPMLPARHSVEE
jgi:hypothetical protein